MTRIGVPLMTTGLKTRRVSIVAAETSLSWLTQRWLSGLEVTFWRVC